MIDRLVYRYHPSTLYVNLTNICTNSCTFCAHSYDSYELGPFNLKLSSERGIAEYLEAISNDMEKQGMPRELVFCGYGEPTLNIDKLFGIAQWACDRNMMVRLNTNGQAALIHGSHICSSFPGLFHRMNISVNAPDSESYGRICRPEIQPDQTWRHMIGFLRTMAPVIPEVWGSAVAAALSCEEVAALRELMRNLGVPLRLR